MRAWYDSGGESPGLSGYQVNRRSGTGSLAVPAGERLGARGGDEGDLRAQAA